MNIRNKMKNAVAITLVAMLITMILPLQRTYASEVVKIPDSDVYLKAISANKVQVIEGDKISEITIKKIDSFTTEIRVCEPGETDQVFTANSADGTVTTDTGVTIDALDEETMGLGETPVVKATTEKYKSKTETKKFSYAKIKKALSSTATVAAIAAAIIALLIAAGYAVPGILLTLIKLLKNVSKLVSLVMDGSIKHGLKI